MSLDENVCLHIPARLHLFHLWPTFLWALSLRSFQIVTFSFSDAPFLSVKFAYNTKRHHVTLEWRANIYFSITGHKSLFRQRRVDFTESPRLQALTYCAKHPKHCKATPPHQPTNTHVCAAKYSRDQCQTYFICLTDDLSSDLWMISSYLQPQASRFLWSSRQGV